MSHDGARELDSDYVAMVILNEKRSRNFLMLPTYLWLQCLFFFFFYQRLYKIWCALSTSINHESN